MRSIDVSTMNTVGLKGIRILEHLEAVRFTGRTSRRV